MELVLISYPEFFKGETEIVTRLLENYDFTFHLRKPEVDDVAYTEFLQQIPESLYTKIVIHQAYNLLDISKFKGVHFSSKNGAVNLEIDTQKVLSTSCHTINEVRNLLANFTNCFLSPVFPSISKQGYNNILDKKELIPFLKEERKLKIIGLGGISVGRIKEMIDYQFDGYATLGAVWTNNPESNNRIEHNFERIYECMMNDHTV